MPLYRRKPMEFYAVQFIDDADHLIEISNMIGKDISVNYACDPPSLKVDLGDGWMTDIPHGAYVIKTEKSYTWIGRKEFESKYELIK